MDIPAVLVLAGIGFQDFQQMVNIGPKVFRRFGNRPARPETCLVKLRGLGTEFSDMLLVEPPRQTVHGTDRIVKNHPGIHKILLVTIGINLIILHQRLRQDIFKRVKQVVRKSLDNPVILLEMFVFSKIGKFRNYLVVVIERDAENVIGRNFGTDILYKFDPDGIIKPCPGLPDNLGIIF